MATPLTDPLVTRLERIRDLADDLARDVGRRDGHNGCALNIAEAMKRDIDAVLRLLKHRSR